MNVKNLLIPLLASLSLTGCWWDVKPVEVTTVCTPKTSLNISDPQPIKSEKVEWFIITPENVDEVFNDLKKKKYDLVLFGLTDDGYENLSTNIIKVRKYLIEQKAIIKAYKDYYEKEERPKDN